MDTRAMDFPDTIYALSSGGLPAGIAVVRISGPGVRVALETLAGGVPPARTARYATLASPMDGSPIDRGLALYFPGPQSVTGEDCGEFHLHGGRAVVAALLAALARLENFRMAEAGEFSRRAFLNGKMDLTAVEGLSDLIAAETEAQRRFAIGNASGRARDLYTVWRDRITAMRARIEADLDFSDQEDVPEIDPLFTVEVDALIAEIDAHISQYRNSEMIRDGFRVVILGAPNAGKSSLLNALAMRDVAIVSDQPGTTRDLIEVALDIGGNKVVVTDTAGVRAAENRIEEIGIGRAIETAAAADLIVHLVDSTGPVEVAIPAGPPVLRVGSKCDLARTNVHLDADVGVSAVTGEGLPKFLELVSASVAKAVGNVSDALPFRERHVQCLLGCRSHLAAGRGVVAEFHAEELRLASKSLGQIVGDLGTEELLGEIFSRFCIGK